MIQLIGRQGPKAIQHNERLRARATLLGMASGTLAILGLFSVVIAVGTTEEVIPRITAGIPLLAAGATAAWAHHARRRVRANDKRIEKIISDVNEELGYPESAPVWSKRGVGPGDRAAMSRTPWHRRFQRRMQ